MKGGQEGGWRFIRDKDGSRSGEEDKRERRWRGRKQGEGLDRRGVMEGGERVQERKRRTDDMKAC